MNEKTSTFKKIDRETLDNLMTDVLKRQFSEAAQNIEEADIGLTDLIRLWTKISDHEKSNTLSQNDDDKRIEFNKLKDEIKNILYGALNDKA